MSLRFGTDGIRGVAFKELTTELSFGIGRAAALVFGISTPFIVGRDTRLSGPDIQKALTEGLLTEGASVEDLGVLPTPAIAYLSAERHMPAAVISASHNSYEDNGIKFFGPGGKKLSDEVEARIECELEQILRSSNYKNVQNWPSSVPEDPILKMSDAYEEHLRAAIANEHFDGLKVVIDCANGAASDIAPRVLRSLGADVVVLNASPDGTNINANCGSTHPQDAQRSVAENKALVGFAFDGDADRLVAIDEQGDLVDGDQIIAMLALDAKANGRLKDDTIVVTVMSNLGLRLSMQLHGIQVYETPVGDRYVLDALSQFGWSLGGEQSGHIIISELATTGDGLLTALCLLSLLKRDGRSLSELSRSSMTKMPQVLRNVRVNHRDALEGATEVWNAVRLTEEKLGNQGRVLLRPSGTEPLIRVMVEASMQETADQICEELCGVVQRVLA